MTSSDVRKILKQMADFNGAFVHAAEVLEAVESRQKELPKLAAEINAKEAEIARFKASCEQWADKASKAKAEFLKEQEAVDKQRSDLHDSLNDLRAQVERAKAEGKEILDAKNAAIADANSRLLVIEQQFKKTQAAIKQFAEQHGMKV